MQSVSPEDYDQVIQEGSPIIDLRSPHEFRRFRVPRSINLPIFSDQQRASISQTFRSLGLGAAERLAESLLNEHQTAVKVQAWAGFLRQYPKSIVASAGGGIRTRLCQRLLAEENLFPANLETGVCGLRKYLQSQTLRFPESKNFLVLAGYPGSGRSDLLAEQATRVCDFEKFANFQGASFGGYKNFQPTQLSFDCAVGYRAVELKQCVSSILVEDDGQQIGQLRIPRSWYQKMKASPFVFVDEPRDERVERIYRKYILRTPATQLPEKFQALLHSLAEISRKLGRLRYDEIRHLMIHAMTKSLMGDLHDNRVWIEKLLTYYFDPLCKKRLNQWNPIVRFSGNYSEVATFLSHGE